MDINEREIFQSVHGIANNQLGSVKSEVETRKMSHKIYDTNKSSIVTRVTVKTGTRRYSEYSIKDIYFC
jgi:hypothetical protein